MFSFVPIPFPMKEYHTKIRINRPVKQVWQFLTDFDQYPNWNPLVGKLEGDIREGGKIATTIVPLGKTYYPRVLSYKENQELVWQGVQGAKFLIAGRHYYRLDKIEEGVTELQHGEYFTGILSNFISRSLLQKMEDTFVLHNEELKEQLEHEG